MASTTKSVAPLLPSAFLPPLKQLHSLTTHSVSLIVSSLADLYQPNLLSIRKSLIPDFVDSGYASGNEDEDEEPVSPLNSQEADALIENEEAWALARADPFERAHALRWMTGFIARASEWVELAGGEESSDDVLEYEEREAVFDAMASLLGACSQASEGGTLLRQFNFSQPRGRPSIVLGLQDQDLNPDDHTAVGLQTWGSATILIQRLCQSPESYGLVGEDVSDERPLRVLELGAGTGLVSLAVGKLLVQRGIPAEIVATDYHPDVLNNLRKNVDANPDAVSPRVGITVALLDWETLHRNLHSSLSEPFKKPFDVVFAADVVYSPNHAKWIASSVSKLMRCPSVNSESIRPSFHLVAPTRATREQTHASIETVFPREANLNVSPHGMELTSEVRLRTIRVHDHARAKGVGRADEESYREYRIEWA